MELTRRDLPDLCPGGPDGEFRGVRHNGPGGGEPELAVLVVAEPADGAVGEEEEGEPGPAGDGEHGAGEGGA